MPKIKNVSPFGDLDVPLLGKVLPSGSITEVTEAEAAILLQQPDNFKPWGEPAKKAQRRKPRQTATPDIPDVAPPVETTKEVNNDDDAA